MSAFPDINTRENCQNGKKGCRQKKGMSGKLANIDVLEQHVADLLPTFPTKWLRFWGAGSLVESKWLDYVIVEADSHLKLLPTSILDMHTVFGHIDMLSIGILYQPKTVIPTLLLGSDFGVLGHLLSQNDIITSWLRLPATSNCFPHPY